LATRVVEVVNNQMTLNPKITEALMRGGLIDITTTGRQSGKLRRIEIVYHPIDGGIYISGMPGFPRGWLANLDANPLFTFHLKGQVKADLPATARIIKDEAERRTILTTVARTWKRKDLEVMVRESPLIEVRLNGAAAA
jgi:deazaflavin-dependent oxidoreductase (nitroreductase family)